MDGGSADSDGSRKSKTVHSRINVKKGFVSWFMKILSRGASGLT